MSAPPLAGRLFLALWPDDAVRDRLARYGDGVRWPRRARRTQVPDLHLTLHFIGPLPEAGWAALRDALVPPLVVPPLEVPPIELVLDGAECWPNGVAVLVPALLPEPLARLHAALGERLQAAGLPLEPRRWRPHVTLARQAQGAELPPPAPIAWRAGGHVLATSTGGTPQASAGARYRVLQRFGEPA